MANKLYEEEEIRQIAISLRANAPQKIGQKELLLSEMSSSVDDVYLEGYENGIEQGYSSGLTDGEEKVKTEEARTGMDVFTLSKLNNRTVGVVVSPGYYTFQVVKEHDASSIFNAGINYVKTEEARTAANITNWIDVETRGVDIDVESGYYANGVSYTVDVSDVYDKGYEDGIVAGKNNEDLADAILSSDANYDDDGNQFYNVYKWIDIWNSNLSSEPVVIGAMNKHESLWMHAYIRGTDLQGGHYVYRSMTIPPDSGENSVEFDIPLESYILEGVRWSTDGI